jgi:hypothetical protein
MTQRRLQTETSSSPTVGWVAAAGFVTVLAAMWATTAVAEDAVQATADAGIDTTRDAVSADVGVAPDTHTGGDTGIAADAHSTTSDTLTSSTPPADTADTGNDAGRRTTSDATDETTTTSGPPSDRSPNAGATSSTQPEDTSEASQKNSDDESSSPSKDEQASSSDDQDSQTDKQSGGERGPPTVSPESLEDGPGPPRPLVLTASVPHLLIGAIKGSRGTYWPMLELTLELQQSQRLSVAPIAGGSFVTTDFGTSGILTAGAQGRAYITDTFNSGIYGSAELVATGVFGSGSADPTIGVPFVYSGVSPSLALGLKLNVGGGFIMDTQVGVGVRNILADEFSIFDVQVDPAADLTLNINLGWGFKR